MNNRNYQTRYRSNDQNSRRYQAPNRRFQGNQRIKRQTTAYPPLQVEADQKQIIIDHLQQEIQVLRSNQEQLHYLQDQYKSLQHRFKILQDEKMSTDNESQLKHQSALKTINQLKMQFDSLRNLLKQKNIQLNYLQNDQNQLVRSFDHLKFTIEQLKSQIKSLLADSQESLNERMKIEQIIVGIRKDNEVLHYNIEDLQKNNDHTKRKIQDMDKYSSKLQIEEKILRDKILGYEHENNQIDNDINSLVEDLANRDTQIAQAQHELSQLQNDVASTSALSQKYKAESLHYQKCTRVQSQKNNDLTKSINQTQNVHKLRVNQVIQGQKQVQNLKQQNLKLGELNLNLSHEVEQCKKHIQNMLLLNSDLVLNLQKYSQQDDIVLNLINRKGRVIKARRRVQQAGVIYKQNIY